MSNSQFAAWRRESPLVMKIVAATSLTAAQAQDAYLVGGSVTGGTTGYTITLPNPASVVPGSRVVVCNNNVGGGVIYVASTTRGFAGRTTTVKAPVAYGEMGTFEARGIQAKRSWFAQTIGALA